MIHCFGSTDAAGPGSEERCVRASLGHVPVRHLRRWDVNLNNYKCARDLKMFGVTVKSFRFQTFPN